MRIPTAVASLALLTAALAPTAPAEAATAPTPEHCAATLECGFSQIELLTMSERLALLRDLEKGPVADYLGPRVDPGRFRNIEGIITLFRNESLGAEGGWVSIDDAAIMEGIERGIAIATGRSTATGNNPSSQVWADYLTRLHDGDLTTRAAHDKAWSDAEEASNTYGNDLATTTYGEYPTATMNRFFQLAEVYRYLLANRPPLADLATGVGDLTQTQEENFYDWATDVTDADAGRAGAEAMWSIAQLDPTGSVLTTEQCFQVYLQDMYAAYQADQG